MYSMTILRTFPRPFSFAFLSGNSNIILRVVNLIFIQKYSQLTERKFVQIFHIKMCSSNELSQIDRHDRISK